MADETESMIAAWLEDSTTKREVGILYDRFPNWSDCERYTLVMLSEILTAMDFYGEPEIIVEKPDDEPPEPWRGH